MANVEFGRSCGAVSVLSLCAAASAVAAPYSFDATPGRLSKDVVPIDYTIHITPDARALSIAGRESVVLEFRRATATLQFDSVNERLTNVRLDGKPVKATASDDERQLTTVTLRAPAQPGRHTLSFAYTGKIEKSARGLFAQDYRLADGTPGLLLSTQFESIDARRMFPCWDEPTFRARFTLSTTLPAAWTAVSNMPVAKRVVSGTLATTTFTRSPKMASYLLELTAGDLARISGEAAGVQLNIWAQRGLEHEGEWALSNAKDILADFNEYFGYPFPLPKLDSIAIPGGWSGAMENWGAITYTEAVLLVTPATTQAERQGVFSVQAHEMSHQWFGDLVTMAWWDEVWLNESMTFWLEQSEIERRHPEWHRWQHEDKLKEVAMRVDAQANAEAIHVHVTDEHAAADAYSQDLVGGKGQTVMRMFEAYLGPEIFRAGLRDYMHTRAFSNATGDDLWSALGRASGKNVAAIAAPWAEQPGFPLVSVAALCAADGARTLSLSQRRFLLSGADTVGLRWSVPLRVRSGTTGAPQSLLLTADAQGIAAGHCGEPLSVNADGFGYFRAAYDEATLAANTRDFATLPDADKIALLDDQWALVQAKAAPLSSYFALAEAMGASLNTRAWEQIEFVLDGIERAERGKPGHDRYTAYARSVLKGPFERLGWDARPGDTPDVQQLRRTLITDLGAWGDQQVVAEARKRYAAFLADHHAVAPDEQGALLDVVAHHADAATFDQLHALAKAATDRSDVQRYFGALMQVDDPALAARAAAIAVSDEIPPQASMIRLHLLATLALKHARLSWDAFTANTERVMQALGGYANSAIAEGMPQIYGTDIPLPELEAWIRGRVPADLAPAVDRAMETARVRNAVRSELVREADAYVH